MPRHKVDLRKETPSLCSNCTRYDPAIQDYKLPCSCRTNIPKIYCRRQVKKDAQIKHYVATKSLPEVALVRKAIESVKVEKYRVFLMAVYLCGAARACEIAYGRASADIMKGYTRNYGPFGDDCWLDSSEPPDPKWLDVLEMLLSIQAGDVTIKEAIANAKERIPIVIFKIKIAKAHGLEPNEDAPYRLVALPLSDEFEPWAKIIYGYFLKHKGEPVFPFSRTDVSDYLTRVDPVFKGLTYRIKKYTYNTATDELLTVEQLNQVREGFHNELLNVPPNKFGLKIVSVDEYEYRMDFYGKIYRRQIYKVLSHPKPLKIHGLRHIRTDELLKYNGFDGVDLVAYVGWSGKGVALPIQATNYAEIRENYQRYIKKLFVPYRWN